MGRPRTQSRRRSAAKAEPAQQGEQRRLRLEQLGELSTLADVQALLGGASRQTVTRLVDRGALRPVKLAEGGRDARGASRLLFSRRELARFIAALEASP